MSVKTIFLFIYFFVVFTLTFVFYYTPTQIAYQFLMQISELRRVSLRIANVFFFQMIPLATLECLKGFVHFNLTDHTFPQYAFEEEDMIAEVFELEEEMEEPPKPQRRYNLRNRKYKN